MNAHQDNLVNQHEARILPEDEVQTVGTSSPTYGEQLDLELPDMGDNPQQEPSQEAEQRKYAGVYQSVEDLEKGYKELQAEYTRLRQAQKAQDEQHLNPQPEQLGGEQAEQQVDPLAAEVIRLRHEMEWQKLEREYGPDIRQKIADYYQQLSPEEQMALDNPAGARLVAKLVSQQGGEQRQPMQPTGVPRSHEAPKPRLTRAEILNMSPEEYQARQQEIMEFYAQQAGQ